MKMRNKGQYLALPLLVITVFLFAAGCTVNINVGNAADTEDITMNQEVDTTFNENVYQSCATVYISNGETTASTSISSSDLAVSKPLVDVCKTMLQSNRIRAKICQEYPAAEFELTLEPMNETEICTIIATSENPEALEEICNMAVSLFCEEVSSIMDGVSCKVVNYAKFVRQVEKNKTP